MTVRIRYKIEVAVSSSANEERDLGNIKLEQISDSQGEGGSWKTLLAAGDDDVLLQLGNVASGKFLFLRATPRDPTLPIGPVTIKLNSATNDPMTLARLSDLKEAHALLCTEGLTAVYVSNPGTSPVELTVFVAGD